MTTRPINLNFTVGSRTIASVSRSLQPVSYTLDNILSGVRPSFPDLDPEAHGYDVHSVPAEQVAEIRQRYADFIIGKPRQYDRCFIDMAGTYDDYLGKFSSKTRSTFGRKKRKLEQVCGGKLDIRGFHTGIEFTAFLEQALPLSRRTYQGRLLNAGLPEKPEDIARMTALANNDRIRSFIMFIDGKPASYLYLPVKDGIISYTYLGYDPDYAHLSTGTILQLEALKTLFEEQRYRYFDFTEGEGSHKKMFATGSATACTFFMLKPTISNRLLIKTLDTFNTSVASASKTAERFGLKSKIGAFLRR